jgi:hypothetical protein
MEAKSSSRWNNTLELFGVKPKEHNMCKILHKNLRMYIQYYSFSQFNDLRSARNGKKRFTEHSHEALV